MNEARPDDDDDDALEEAESRKILDDLQDSDEMEDGLLAESIILGTMLSRSQDTETNASIPLPHTSSTPTINASSSLPGHSQLPPSTSSPPHNASSSVPGAFGVSRRRWTPPSTIRQDPETSMHSHSPSDASSTADDTSSAPFERAYRVLPRRSPAPTTPLPKYALRDGAGMSMGSIDASMEEDMVADDSDSDASAPSGVHPPEGTVSTWNFPPIEAFSAPAETEALQVAVPFVDDDDDPKRPADVGSRPRRTLWMVLAGVVVIAVLSLVVGLCADGSCTRTSAVVPPELRARDRAIYDYINEITFASTKPFSYFNQSHPEEQALRWIVAEDPLQLSTPQDVSRIVQRYALLTLWYTNVPSNTWVNDSGWLNRDDECTWAGISCDNNATVTGIDLEANGIHGGVPPDLALLSDLRDLSVTCQNLVARSNSSCLSGTVPPSLATLPRIRNVNFDTNNLTGPVSLWLGHWSDLETIDISANHLTGTLPAAVLGTWTRLSSVDFGYNQLWGSFAGCGGALEPGGQCGAVLEFLFRNIAGFDWRLDELDLYGHW
jgi:hypothetical protein